MKIDRKYLEGRRIKLVTSTPYTVNPELDEVLLINFAGAVTINLPAGTPGKELIIRDESDAAYTNNITIVPNGSDTIEEGGSYILNLDGEAVWIVFNQTATDWQALAAPFSTELQQLTLSSSTMGLESGGVLSAGAGLSLNVASGVGYQATGLAVRKFEWSGTAITLADNSNLYIFQFQRHSNS